MRRIAVGPQNAGLKPGVWQCIAVGHEMPESMVIPSRETSLCNPG